MGHGDHLRMCTVTAMLLAHLQELSRRTAHSHKLEGDSLGLEGNAMSRRGRRTTAASPSPLHGVATLGRASDECCLQMIDSFLIEIPKVLVVVWPELLTS